MLTPSDCVQSFSQPGCLKTWRFAHFTSLHFTLPKTQWQCVWFFFFFLFLLCFLFLKKWSGTVLNREIKRLHIHSQTLTSMFISKFLSVPRRLTPGKVCKFPAAFLPGEECQRKSGAILNQFKNAWNVCSWTFNCWRDCCYWHAFIYFFPLHTWVQEKKISCKSNVSYCWLPNKHLPLHFHRGP